MTSWTTSSDGRESAIRWGKTFCDACSCPRSGEPGRSGKVSCMLPVNKRRLWGQIMPRFLNKQVYADLLASVYGKVTRRYELELGRSFVFGEDWVGRQMRRRPDKEWDNALTFEYNVEDIYPIAKAKAVKVGAAPRDRPARARPLSEAWAAAAYATVCSESLQAAVSAPRTALWASMDPLAVVGGSEPDAIAPGPGSGRRPLRPRPSAPRKGSIGFTQKRTR